MQAVLQTLNNM
jgi:hypothetical protein